MIYRFRGFGRYLKDKYGEKAYKIPINIPATCPNRDGTKGNGGCIFCGEEGAGAELLDSNISILEQIKTNVRYIGDKYNVKRFIAYLQNYSSTYLPIDIFKANILTIINSFEDMVAIYISTRPDCLGEEYLVFLKEIKDIYEIDVVLEIGLQSANDDTLKALNRGHDLKCFIDSVKRAHMHSIEVCAHVITDLPFESIQDTIDTAIQISKLGIEQVKCHSLYILKDTVLGEMYAKGEIGPVSYIEYIDRIVAFIRHTHKDVIFQRIIGRAPKDKTLFCNWDKSWWKIRDEVFKIMGDKGYMQGDLFT